MKPSLTLKSPVVTFLSSSRTSSRFAQQLLRDLFSFEPLPLPAEEDELDQTLRIPGFGRRWDSVASKCGSSGIVLHFISLTSGSKTTVSESTLADEDNTGPLSLLGISSKGSNSTCETEGVKESRQMLASHLLHNEKGQFMQSLRLALNHAAGRSISVADILGFSHGLPLLDLSTHNENPPSPCRTGLLKEVAIPNFDDSAYPDGRTLLSTLSSSALPRPAVGLYLLNGLAIRPLPSAQEDQRLPMPSLVFYCEDLNETAARLDGGASFAKIGYNGLEKSGQIMVSHKHLPGLDIRLTDSMEYTSAFAEAQDALFASSLDELQNANVLGGGGQECTVDKRTNEGDCWVEFRASMKRPSGFMKRGARSNPRTAKAPDLPFE